MQKGGIINTKRYRLYYRRYKFAIDVEGVMSSSPLGLTIVYKCIVIGGFIYS